MIWPDPTVPPFDDLASPSGSSASRTARPLRHDRRPPEVAPFVPTLAELLRVTIDIAPAAGSEVPDRVLGRLVDDLDQHVDAHRKALIVAVAAGCFLVPDDEVGQHERTPYAQWARRSPIPSVRERAAFRAVGKAPWAAWRMVSVDPLVISDLTGLGPRYVPDGPVGGLDAIAPLVPLSAGVTLLAKAVPVQGAGWSIALGITASPADAAPIAAAVRDAVEAAQAMREDPEDVVTIEEGLAACGHRLVRALLNG